MSTGIRAKAFRRAAACVAVVLVAGAGCSNDNGKDKGDAATTTTAPRTTARSPVVQLRVVTGNPDDCGALPAAPDPAQPYSVLHTTQCVALAPAGLVISRAEVSTVVDANSGQERTVFKLSGEDVGRLAAFSTEASTKQVALVAFGRVLVLASMRPATDGSFEVGGVGHNDALRLKEALA